MKRNFFPVLILSLYAFLYIATTKKLPCEGDCESVSNTYITLQSNRDYVYGVFRCDQSDLHRLCVMVKDTTGINWSLFADTACMVASQHGLNNQQIYILKNGTVPYDTLVRKTCP